MAPRTANVVTPQAVAVHDLGTQKSSGIVTPIHRNKHSHHANMTAKQARQAIVSAAKDGYLRCVQQLLRKTGPSVLRGSTLLHVAAEHNQVSVALFVMQFISPNAVNADGSTPAHLAARKGHTQVLSALLRDPFLDITKRDRYGYTFKQLLCAPLFDAVLKWDNAKIKDLLNVGADPDTEAGGVVGGALVRELRVTTARQLARALGRDQQTAPMFGLNNAPKPRISGVSSKLDQSSTPRGRSAALHQLPMGSLRLQVAPSEVAAGGQDVYQTNDSSPGYVCVLNYGAFQYRPDLHLGGSEADAHNLATVFNKMGYTGHTHFSLTADQTRHELTRLRDMQEVRQASCLVFVISSHGTSRQQFLTSDMQLLHTQWVLDLFKDSQCPHLKDKPKVFLWDLCHGQYRENHIQNIQGYAAPQHGRLDEPLRDVVCVHSSSGGFTNYTFTRDGTPFTKALCRTLAHHAHHKDLDELYRALLAEYRKAAPGVVPTFTNIGFSKRFFFNPRPEANA
ncbi:uncharacterized protein LOC123517439 [Portunus trituberculatus]|uniref:uncharacterized protein LOC123517439 n=1 Tax=Portunus trituberculatus TaxID=210409 RepID=UPI001E1CB239|nr:uncharacterized protein LOC123517439 [Portunus trituberculatus]